MLPVIRFSMKMHDSKDSDMVQFDAIQDSVWESFEQTSPNVSFLYGPCRGKVLDGVDGCFDLLQEVSTNAFRTGFVILGSSDQFSVGFGW